MPTVAWPTGARGLADERRCVPHALPRPGDATAVGAAHRTTSPNNDRRVLADAALTDDCRTCARPDGKATECRGDRAGRAVSADRSIRRLSDSQFGARIIRPTSARPARPLRRFAVDFAERWRSVLGKCWRPTVLSRCPGRSAVFAPCLRATGCCRRPRCWICSRVFAIRVTARASGVRGVAVRTCSGGAPSAAASDSGVARAGGRSAI